jgi:hypothetical protein
MTTTPAAVEALKLARAHIVWLAFGECRSPGWNGAPPSAREAVDAIDAALAHQPPANTPPTGVSGSQAKSEAVAWQVKQKTYKDRGPWVRATYEAAAQYPHRCEVRALVPQEAVERQPLTDEQVFLISERALDKCHCSDSRALYVAREVERHFGIGPATQEKQHG